MKKYNVIFIAFLLAIVGSISVKAQEHWRQNRKE